MLKCLIVDDEMPAREELKYMLSSIDNVSIIGEADNGIRALDIINTLNPDIVFLDVQMPKISGIEVAKKLVQDRKDINIIFITAYENFAVDAFDVNAVDYLLKPISKERLDKAIKRIISLNHDRDKLEYNRLKSIIEDIGINKSKNINRISVYYKNKLIPIEVKDILYVTVEDKSTVIVTKDGKYEINYSLNELTDKLSEQTFFRTHKSYIVNLDMIESIEPWFNSTYNINLKHINQTIPVSRSHIKNFKEKMNIE